jgi:hypothetical protein
MRWPVVLLVAACGGPPHHETHAVRYVASLPDRTEVSFDLEADDSIVLVDGRQRRVIARVDDPPATDAGLFAMDDADVARALGWVRLERNQAAPAPTRDARARNIIARTALGLALWSGLEKTMHALPSASPTGR